MVKENASTGLIGWINILRGLCPCLCSSCVRQVSRLTFPLTGRSIISFSPYDGEGAQKEDVLIVERNFLSS